MPVISGLRIKGIEIIASIMLAVILTIFSYILIKNLATSNNISIQFSTWQNYYHDIFYTLNEEIIIGAMLLHLLIRKARFSSLLSSVLLALVFAFLHFVFYKWVFLDRGNIEIMTLATLFFVGILRNNLIIITGHIAYSWALHFAWIAIMFGSYHCSTINQENISELTRFNTYLGSTEMLIISITLATGSFLFWNRRKIK